MSASLHVLPVPGLLNVPTLLRNIADNLEAGEYGDVQEGALVLAGGGELNIFGLGRVDGPTAHYLLALGQRKLERIDIL